MIKTSKNKLRTVIAGEYIRMLSESRNLSEEQIQELGKWWKQRQAKKGLGAQAQSPKRVDVGGGAEVLDPEIADFEQQLGGASWASDDIESLYPPERHRAAKTQTQMRTMDINKGEKRPYAKKVGLAESQLRSLISDMVRKKLTEHSSGYEEWMANQEDDYGVEYYAAQDALKKERARSNLDDYWDSELEDIRHFQRSASKNGMSLEEYLSHIGMGKFDIDRTLKIAAEHL